MKNERGSLLVALLLGLSGLMGILALFDYFDSAHISLAYARNVGTVQADVIPVANRITTCVSKLTTSDCPPAPFNLTALRDAMSLANTTVSPVTFSLADLQALGLGTGYAAATATVTRMASIDDIWYGSTNISISVKITPAAATHLAPRQVDRTYRLSVSSPVTWALLIRKSNLSPAINLDATSHLTVYGGMLYWSQTANVTPTTLVDSTTAMNFWTDHLDMTASNFNVSSSAADQATFNYLRALGLRINALNGVWYPFGQAEWQERLDYGYVYTAGSYPLPTGTTNTASLGMGGPSPGDIDVARANVTTFPDATVMPGLSLETTCDRPSDFQRGSSHSLILSRINDDLTFDFNPAGLPAQFACGLIIANTITVNTRPGQTSVWYGHLNAKQLNITGGGTLVIVNPFDPLARPTSLPSPANMSLAEMAQTDLSLASSTAWNFFVPFVTNYAQLPANLQYRSLGTVDTFDDTCLSGTRSCWQTTVVPPDPSNFLKVCASAPCWYDVINLGVREGM